MSDASEVKARIALASRVNEDAITSVIQLSNRVDLLRELVSHIEFDDISLLIPKYDRAMEDLRTLMELFGETEIALTDLRDRL